jgi:hypothetical protein
MKKKNLGLMIIAALLIVVTISVSTFAIYKSSATGTTSVEVAKWGVKVNSEDIVTTDTITFNTDDIIWEENTDVKDGKVAPGSVGKIEFEIDASESEVSVDYVVELDTDNIDNENITISTDEEEGTISYSDTASNMKKTVTIDIVWDAEDTDAANEKDLAMAGKTIEIPVKVTATQHVG